MSVMPLTDAVFLIAEAREHPMHVGGLHLYRPPEDAGPTHVADLYRTALEHGDIRRRLRRRPVRPLGGVGVWRWQDDADLDLEYHVRHSALPHPGRIRELLALVSRLHGTLLDRTRPLWEAHLIEGLADGRFATYTKIHHAMMDGVAAMRLLEQSLSTDPDERDMPPPLAERPRPSSGRTRSSRGLLDVAGGIVSQAVEGAKGAVGAGEEALRSLGRSFVDEAATFPFRAPPSMFNVPITGARRFAAESWPLERLRHVGKGLGGTLNDVVLAMSAGALRRYMDDLNALPEDPLVAMVPVSLRGEDDDDDGGNRVGLILCNLGTHLADPLERFGLIHESAQQGKLQLEGLNQAGVLLLSAMSFAPLSLGPLFRFEALRRPPFNIVISNVPGPRQPLYWNGAELDGVYPASIPIDGQALNITCTSWADRIGFGLTGCRRSVPSLQRLLEHLETSLVELEDVA
ncbi:MAG TPA: wax ester/triacylglycerol synthase family O-acyltransferase [Egibacteraceae bacterium]|nr:wax ester/triacylglycerol synthase family O-acyltransferase [Egibacteraceae bacterium]